MPRPSFLFTLVCMLLAVGCARTLPLLPRSGLGPPPTVDARPAPSAAWSHSPPVLERLLRSPLDVLQVERVERGRYGVLKLTVRDSRGTPVDLKWKPARPGLERINNSPRRAVAAYTVQKLIFDPTDYVVPTTALACVPLGPRFVPEPRRSETRCVLGALSAWLDGLDRSPRLIDRRRFAEDPLYARYRANLNLLLILIDHSDSHGGNLLESTLDRDRRLFSIDNDIAFGSWFRNPFVHDWNRLRVPALHRQAIDRLRRLERRDVDSLGVVGQLERTPEGHWLPAPRGENLDPRRGVRVVGDVVQIGLAQSEIDRLWRRRGRILELVDRGRIRTF